MSVWVVLCIVVGIIGELWPAFLLCISLFGLNSGVAFATVVGVLVEVPVMLTLVKITNNSQKINLKPIVTKA